MQARLKNEEEFEWTFGVEQIPYADWAWSIINGKDGGRERHDDCVRGFHEFVWMSEVCDHVCFFCLKVEEFSEDESMGYAEDDWCMPQVKGHGRKVADELEPKSGTDSQNEDDE